MVHKIIPVVHQMVLKHLDVVKSTWIVLDSKQAESIDFYESSRLLWICSEEKMAVREGFEPSIPFGIHTFQACSFGHSDTSPFKLSYFNVLTSPFGDMADEYALACQINLGGHSDTSPFKLSCILTC